MVLLKLVDMLLKDAHHLQVLQFWSELSENNTLKNNFIKNIYITLIIEKETIISSIYYLNLKSIWRRNRTNNNEYFVQNSLRLKNC